MFDITNNASSESIGIKGFRLETNGLPDARMASYLEIPQGSQSGSVMLRFVTSLDELEKEDGRLFSKDAASKIANCIFSKTLISSPSGQSL